MRFRLPYRHRGCWNTFRRSRNSATWMLCSFSNWTAPISRPRTGCALPLSSPKNTTITTALSSPTERIRWHIPLPRCHISCRTAHARSCLPVHSARSASIRLIPSRICWTALSALPLRFRACLSFSAARSCSERVCARPAQRAFPPFPARIIRRLPRFTAAIFRFISIRPPENRAFIRSLISVSGC